MNGGDLMNRNKTGQMPEITRTVYKSVKKMDRMQFQNFCTSLYQYGFQDGKEEGRNGEHWIDLDKILEAVAKVKGIGPKKMEEIRERVNEMFEEKQAAD